MSTLILQQHVSYLRNDARHSIFVVGLVDCLIAVVATIVAIIVAAIVALGCFDLDLVLLKHFAACLYRLKIKSSAIRILPDVDFGHGV